MNALTFDPATDQFHIHELPIPEPGDSDVLVRVDACALNPVDAKILYWKRGVADMDASWTPGLDVSGTIVAVGNEVKGWSVGDRVLYHGNMFRPHGGFADYAIHAAATLTRHPHLPASIAAATPCAGWTAWRALVDKLGARNNDSILIMGGSGGVGGFAVQLARYLGLETIIATCSSRNVDYVSQLGATHVIDYTRQDVVARVMAITAKRGVSLGLDTVGGDNDITLAACLAFEGHMAEIATTVRPRQYHDAFGRGLSFHQLSLGASHRNGVPGERALVSAGEAFSQLVENGHIQIPILQTIPMADVGAALEDILRQRTVGKIVMENRAL